MSEWKAYPDCYNCAKTGPCPCFQIVSWNNNSLPEQRKGEN